MGLRLGDHAEVRRAVEGKVVELVFCANGAGVVDNRYSIELRGMTMPKATSWREVSDSIMVEAIHNPLVYLEYFDGIIDALDTEAASKEESRQTELARQTRQVREHLAKSAPLLDELVKRLLRGSSPP